MNRFLYNEKELQVGSGFLDYGARMYMPEVGRWGTFDPLADVSRRFSPYVYGYNNPLKYIDPDGRLADDPQKGILQRIFDFLGFFKRPESQEEAATYANRQERFNETVSTIQKGADELKSKAEWVPFLGPVTDISQGAVKKDRTQVVLGMAGLVGDALGGEVRARNLFEFTGTAAKHMDEEGRMIPIQILDDIIKTPISVVKDPHGTNAIMHYSQMWKNGKLYNVEVLYDKVANRIMHFKYTQKSLGSLPAIN